MHPGGRTSVRLPQLEWGRRIQVAEKAPYRRGRFTRWIPFRAGVLAVFGCSLAALLAASASAVDPTFTQAPGSPISTGSGAISVVAANLNGAGGLDLAVANQGANNVSILLGNGSGGFTPAGGSPVSVGVDPVAVVAANLNGAGGLDLAVVNENAANPGDVGSVSILLGNGTGGFSNAAGSPIAVGGPDGAPQSIAVGDLNGTGGLDLAVVNEGANNVSILLGNGSGGFAPGSSVTVGSLPQSIATGLFNADAILDLAVVNEGTNNVSILLGNGTGGFTPGSPVSTGAAPSDVGTADVNADAKADLIVANTDGNSVSILLGSGTGGFSNAAGSPVTGLNGPEGSAVADYNADGKLDLAVANTGSTNLSILVGNGLGGFSASGSPLPAAGAPTTIVAANLNGDTKPDLAVANYDTGNVTVQLNTTLPPPTAVAVRSFSARATRQGIELRWRTAQEASILGFDVYRAGVQVNRTLIQARGSGVRGAAYRLLDRSARGAAATYRLRAVRADGSRAWIGRAVARR